MWTRGRWKSRTKVGYGVELSGSVERGLDVEVNIV